jgi:Co-chaperonin GroES (HSP10)
MTGSVNLGHHSSGPDRHEFDTTGTMVSVDDIEALSNIVIVEAEVEEVSKGGILIADVGEAQKVRWGRVLKVGPGRVEDGTFVPTTVRVGDRVMFGKYASAGEPIKIGVKEYRLFREGDLFARVKGDA